MTPEQLAEIERLATLAWPGEWAAEHQRIELPDVNREPWEPIDCPDEATAAYIAAANPATVLDLIAYIRDRDGVGSPCIHELSPDELTGVATHLRDLEAQMWKLEWSGRTEGAPYSMGGPPVGSAPSCPFCHGLKPGLDAPRALGMSADQEGHRADCWYATATPPSPEVGE